MWTNAGPQELVPAVAELFEMIPSPASHVFGYAWREQELSTRPPFQGSLYLAAFMEALRAQYDPQGRFLSYLGAQIA